MRKIPRILVMMPEIDARKGGGILQVGQSVLRLLSAKQQDGGVECHILSLGTPEQDGESQSICQAWGPRLRCYGAGRMRFSLRSLVQMAAWADVAVFTHLGLASLLSVVPGPLRPASLTLIYGLDVWRTLNRRHALGLRHSDLVVGISQYTIRRAREYNPWLDGVRHCPLGIREGLAADDDAEAEAALGLTPTCHDILVVGRMAKGEGQKGHRELIQAMERVVREIPAARLIIAGSGDDVDTYREMARRTSAAERILFCGYVPDPLLRTLYRRVGVFAMPSRQEGFGLVYLEAMAAGLPCVASPWDAAGEVVLDGQTGVLVDPSDQGALVHALTTLLCDEDLRKRLGRQGRKRFEEQFTEARFHQRFWGLVEEVLQGR